jgi:MOSC domain-containing protein YiiM
MSGSVRTIHVGATHGAELQSVESVVAVAGMGLVGDRNYGTVRNVTIVCDGELSAAAVDLGVNAVPPGATRRNVTVTLDALPRRHGTKIQLGDVQVEVWRDASPCEVMEESVGPGAREALRGRAGISATVTEGGTIRVGDPVVIEEG